eukprot:CAMPEP_0183298058 /NCGR_PEP_ID=MMETSP0160_2-20130417/5185_1 /TAXON_ID=2839 ORGANISM="Odontella Sinensis, Strain Grunow 1884" /NCGR_SAMPLE_ID=MMETSP0160_2 /ASSEMBLY_ACC=CAM_ASM_000250 /LENGTH=119 /DNA_ID=CAMNT_0025460005 /DNA_START=459 /DNA_END=818 /DNA_ORIENTATION=-
MTPAARFPPPSLVPAICVLCTFRVCCTFSTGLAFRIIRRAFNIRNARSVPLRPQRLAVSMRPAIPVSASASSFASSPQPAPSALVLGERLAGMKEEDQKHQEEFDPEGHHGLDVSCFQV